MPLARPLAQGARRGKTEAFPSSVIAVRFDLLPGNRDCTSSSENRSVGPHFSWAGHCGICFSFWQSPLGITWSILGRDTVFPRTEGDAHPLGKLGARRSPLSPHGAVVWHSL